MHIQRPHMQTTDSTSFDSYVSIFNLLIIFQLFPHAYHGYLYDTLGDDRAVIALCILIH